MRPIPQIAVDFVAAHEAFRSRAYQDSAGIWTVGYGHIAGITATSRCTKDQALIWLEKEMHQAAEKLYGVLKADIIEKALTEHQWAALLSFCYNVGASSSWSIWKRINARQFDQVPALLMAFVKARDPKTGQLVKVQGLVNRRADEVKLWSTDEPGSISGTVASSVTRNTDTPPVPASPTPPQRSPAIIAGAVSAVAAVPAAVDQVSRVVAPYADKSEMVSKLIATLATIGAIAAVVVLILNWMKKRKDRT